LATATQKLAEASNAADESDRYDFKKHSKNFQKKSLKIYAKIFQKNIKITKNLFQNFPKKSKNHQKKNPKHSNKF
jgi:hypothetical protein